MNIISHLNNNWEIETKSLKASKKYLKNLKNQEKNRWF